MIYIYNYIKKYGCPLSPIPFGIYIDKFKGYLEEVGCVDTILVGIVVILFLYADDIVLLARCLSYLDKQLRLLKVFYSTTNKEGLSNIMLELISAF